MRARFPLSLLLIAFLLLAALAAPFTPRALAAPPRPVIIDTDMALDDWIAILYLLQRPDLSVRAVTISGTGEAHCKPGIQNAQHLLALAGQPGIPVACGRATPLQGSHTFPQGWRDSMDSMLGLPLPANPAPEPEIGAVDLIAGLLADSAQPVTLLTLGPLTNVGELLAAQPGLAGKFERIVIMGGAVDVPGNLFADVPDNTAAEWNVYVDPHAAQLVLASGAPVVLVPLDVTNTVPMTWEFYTHLQHDRLTPPADFVFKALSKSRPFLRSGGYYFWDPLAAAIAADASLARIETRALRVVEDEGPQAGQTVIDPAGSPVGVAVAVDGARFTTTLVNILNGRPEGAPLPPFTATPEHLEANKQTVLRWYDRLWGHQDRMAAEALAARDYLLHLNNNDAGLAPLEDTVDQLHAALPDLTVSVEIAAAEGDSVAVRVTLRGTHTGSAEQGLFAVPPTGHAITVHFNSVIYLVDGKLVEEWLTVDLLGLLTQLGALPAVQP